MLEEVRASFGEPGGGLDPILDAALGGSSLDLLLAHVEDVPVGLVSVALAPTSQGSGLFAWLDDLYVRPAHRRLGLGRLLVESAIERARARGASEIRLAAAMGDAGVVALYRDAGFAASGQAVLARSLHDEPTERR